MKIKKMFFAFIGAAVAVGALAGLMAPKGMVSTSAAEGDVDTSALNFRMWVNRGNYTDGNVTYVRIYDEEGTAQTIEAAGYAQVQTDARWLAYYDVPKTAIGRKITFYIRNNADTWNTEADEINTGKDAEGNNTFAPYTYFTGDNAQIYYIWDDGTHFSRGSLQSDFGANSAIPAAYKHVLEGYYTCSSDMDNGYGNWAEFTKTWIHNPDAGEGGMWFTPNEGMDQVLINDFEGKDYANGERVENSTNVWTKYNAMNARYEASIAESSPLFGISFGNMDNGIIIAVVTLLSVVSVSAIVFISMKRRHSKKN